MKYHIKQKGQNRTRHNEKLSPTDTETKNLTGKSLPLGPVRAILESFALARDVVDPQLQRSRDIEVVRCHAEDNHISSFHFCHTRVADFDESFLLGREVVNGREHGSDPFPSDWGKRVQANI